MQLILNQPEQAATGRDILKGNQKVTPECAAAAIALHARCPVTDGGSAVVVSPVSGLATGSGVHLLSSALQQIGAGPVLTMQFGSHSGEGPEEASPGYRLSAANGDLSVQPFSGGSGPSGTTESARVDASAIAPALIASEKYHELIKTLKTRFRYILIEGAPLGDAAVSLLLAQKSDGLVFTVREGETELRTLSEAAKVAARARIPVLGFFFERGAGRTKRTA